MVPNPSRSVLERRVLEQLIRNQQRVCRAGEGEAGSNPVYGSRSKLEGEGATALSLWRWH
jgi:hypothetical protein